MGSAPGRFGVVRYKTLKSAIYTFCTTVAWYGTLRMRLSGFRTILLWYGTIWARFLRFRTTKSWYGTLRRVFYMFRTVPRVDAAIRNGVIPMIFVERFRCGTVRNLKNCHLRIPYHESMVRNTEKRDLCVPYRTIGKSSSME